MKKIVYICDSCGKMMDYAKHTLRTKDYLYCLQLTVRRKVHLCDKCFNGLKSIEERAKNE